MKPGKIIDRTKELFFQSTLPIFATKNNKMDKIGSGLLLRFQNNNYLITCSHVTRDYRKFYIPNNTDMLIQLNSEGFTICSENVNPGSDNDNFDISLFKISDSEMLNFGNRQFVTDSNFFLENHNENNNYLLFGYPNSKTFLNPIKKKFKANTFEYIVQYNSSRLNMIKYNLDLNYNIPLTYQKRDIFNGFRKGFVPDPWGLSGCGTWVRVTSKESDSWLLAGILIGGHPRDNFAYSTTLKAILNYISETQKNYTS
ncbi:hypothetical protein CH372_18465 [Leptospira meyeri]|uniref:hypothetical protein n=1 Tax=Leptospira meyeri TaxID=29508 RepID=UPI000C2B1F89|nr:hypothetical protein [Leptospira meyeri]PKA10626.1 hypothetical protein CH372_18465 [Leptospira meyeri]PKA23937.1 hypothetical protein CH381_23045 [Leptospira sp. mixed culture ATI2-C-A1]